MYYTFCNQTYLPWLQMLIRSIRRLDRDTPILAHYIGDIEAARRSLEDVSNIEIEPPDILLEEEFSPAGLLEVRACNWVSVARSRDFDWLMIMDADLLVRQSLKTLINSIALYDLGAVIRGKTDGGDLAPELQVSAALSIFAKTGIPVLECMLKLLCGTGPVRGVNRGDWYWDQACFAEAVLTSDLRIHAIPREIYLSSRPFDERAAIWSANFSGQRKGAAQMMFMRELQRWGVPCNQ